MKLILTSTVDKLGIAGDVVEVRSGYSRDYLVLQGRVIVWSRGAERWIEGIKRARDAREVRGVKHTQELRTQIEELAVKAPARTTKSGSLFGAVTAANLALAVKKAGGPATGKRSVSLTKSVKTVGNHITSVKLHPAITARVGFEMIPA